MTNFKGLIAVASLACMAMACSKSPEATPPKKPGTLVVKAISAPPDVRLDVACTPTGPELCFDAIDNNCNSIIDEGCGVRTGIIQFSIAWSDPAADVDLTVTDPKGEAASGSGDTTRTGLSKDRNCPDGDSCQGQNTENVFLIEPEIPRGVYKVSVRWVRLGTLQPPLKVRFSARMGQRVYSSVLEFPTVSDEKLLTFAM